MKFILLTIFAILSAALPLHNVAAQCNEANTTTLPGEFVNYKAYYNWHFIWLNAGEASFSTSATTWNSEPCYRFEAAGATYSGYDFFFRVRDTFNVVVDTASLTPIVFNQINYEGKNTTINHYEFDRVRRVITGQGTIAEGKKTLSDYTLDMPWPECSYDLLTMVYKARNIDFSRYAEGDKIPIKLIVNNKIHNLYIRYLGRETVSTRNGRTFRCLKFTPLLVSGTMFTGGEDMTVWLTDDACRIPIIVEAKVLVGSVKAIFDSASGLRHPLSSEVR